MNVQRWMEGLPSDKRVYPLKGAGNLGRRSLGRGGANSAVDEGALRVLGTVTSHEKVQQGKLT